MASGDSLYIFTPAANTPPAALAATPDTRNAHLVLDFDAGTDEEGIFPGLMPQSYSANIGVTARVVWLASSATSGDVVLAISLERHEDDVDDLDSDTFAAANTVTATAASASGEPQYTEISFTAGSDMDSIVKGESFRLKFSRLGSDGSDDMAGDLELLRIELRET